ncbi:CopC domain-containing protein [Micrococcales bacterium KH10]|nr:CopC domain-containing protein [Micrococcales bacterium KH10]
MNFYHSTAQNQRSGRSLVTVLGALLLVVALAVVIAPQARAHDVLISTKPAEGASIKTLPEQVKVTMSANLTKTGAVIKVVGPDGEQWDEQDTSVSGTDAVVSLREGGPAGEYQVTWRVVSSDGHPVSGEYTFTTSRDAAEPEPDTAVTPDEPSSDQEAVDPTEPPVAPEPDDAQGSDPGEDQPIIDEPIEEPNDDQPEGTQEAENDASWSRVAIIALIGVVIGIGLYFFRSTRRRAKSDN